MNKEEVLLEKRLVELSRIAYHRDIVTFSDFLNLNELNILHSLPKDKLYCSFITFGGYETAERQMAAFLPDALSLCTFPFSVARIDPLNEKYAEPLTHRDYLGALINLGIERSKLGDILIEEKRALIIIHKNLFDFIQTELVRVRHTSVFIREEIMDTFSYSPKFEEIKGTVASVRLDSLLSLAFASSRTKLSGLIEGAKVFVNGKLITTNSYHVQEEDVISVRGMGKFKFKSTLAKTKKNRIFVVLHKYI